VFTVDDVLERLAAGADVVQLYTALVYEGPGLVHRLVRELRGRLAARGVSSLTALATARLPGTAGPSPSS